MAPENKARESSKFKKAMNGLSKDKSEKTDSGKDKTAVALSYKPKDQNSAPVVLASGKGSVAERILGEALENDIPIHKDPDLVEVLAATELGEEIPIEAFIAVSEILRYVYKANGTKPPLAPKAVEELRK